MSKTGGRCRWSDRFGTALPGSNLDRVGDGQDEYLSVALLAGVGGLADGVDDVVGGDVRDDALDFDLLVEVDGVLLAAPLALLRGL